MKGRITQIPKQFSSLINSARIVAASDSQGTGTISTANLALEIARRIVADTTNHGIATLVDGKVKSAQMPWSAEEYQGTYDADANSPALANGTGTNGAYYHVTTAGSNTPQSEAALVGDRIVYSAASGTWDVVGGTANVLNGKATASAARTSLGVTAAEDGVINIADYGAVGDGATNDTAAVIAAYTARSGTLFIPNGTHKMYATLDIPNTITGIQFESAAAVLDFSSAVAGNLTDNVCVKWSGASDTALPAPAADIAKFADTIEFATSPGLARGDLVRIDSTRVWNGVRSTYLAGEYLEVASVSGNTVTFTGSTIDAYTVAEADLFKVSGGPSGMVIGGHIKGLADDTNPTTTLLIEGGRDVRLLGTKVTEGASQNLHIKECYNFGVLFCTLDDDHSSDFGTDYALNVSNSQVGMVIGNKATSARTAFVTGGGSTVPNRYIVYQGNYTNESGLARAFNLHGNSEWVVIDGNIFHGSVDIGGDNIILSTNQIFGKSGNDEALIQIKEALGTSFKIDSNQLSKSGIKASRGNLIDFGGNTDEFNTYTTRGGTLSITNNEMDWDPGEDTTEDLCVIYRRGSTASGVRVVCQGNEFASDYQCGRTLHIKYSSGAKFDRIKYGGNDEVNCASLRTNDPVSTEDSIAIVVDCWGNTTEGVSQDLSPYDIRNVDEISFKQNKIRDCKLYSIFGGYSGGNCEIAIVADNEFIDSNWSESGGVALGTPIRFEYCDYTLFRGNTDLNRTAKILVADASSFEIGETVNNLTDPGNSAIVYDKGTGILFVKRSAEGQTFTASDTIEGASSGATTTVTAVQAASRYKVSYSNVVKAVQDHNWSDNYPQTQTKSHTGSPGTLVETI